MAGTGYAKLGSAAGSILSRFLGGEDASTGADSKAYLEGLLAGAKARKLSLEAQKIEQELNRKPPTGQDFAPIFGFSPEDYRQVQIHDQTGKYTAPYNLSNEEVFPGESTDWARGLENWSDKRPEYLTDQDVRNIRSANAMAILNNLASGKTNASQLADVPAKIQKGGTLTDMLAGVEQPERIAPIMAAFAGKNPDFSAAGGGAQDPSRIREVNILMSRFNFPEDEAFRLVYPERGVDLKDLEARAISGYLSRNPWATQDEIDEFVSTLKATWQKAGITGRQPYAVRRKPSRGASGSKSSSDKPRVLRFDPVTGAFEQVD